MEFDVPRKSSELYPSEFSTSASLNFEDADEPVVLLTSVLLFSDVCFCFLLLSAVFCCVLLFYAVLCCCMLFAAV